jgi:hypothetical protein
MSKLDIRDYLALLRESFINCCSAIQKNLKVRTLFLYFDEITEFLVYI